MSPVGINGVDKQGVAVNGAQVKQALDADNETVDKGVYDATTLSAVDTDLAAGNIKDGVEIFGVTGTLEGTIETTEAFYRAIENLANVAQVYLDFTFLRQLNVPANAKQIQSYAAFHCETQGGQAQCLYNGVQKAVTGFNADQMTGKQMDCAGIGAGAVLQWQALVSTGTHTVIGSGAGWYQTIA